MRDIRPFDRIDGIDRDLGAVIALQQIEIHRGEGLAREPFTRFGLVVGGKLEFGEHRLAVEGAADRSEEHTSELQSLMRTSYAVFCLKQHTHLPDTATQPLP